MKKYLMKNALGVFTRRCNQCNLLYISSARTGKVCKKCHGDRGSGAITDGMPDKEITPALKIIIKRKRDAEIKRRGLISTKP